MKITTVPKEFACELLTFIAEKEDFSEVCKVLDGEVSATEIKALLREIATELQKEAAVEGAEIYDVKKCKHLSRNSKKIISYLSPHEEKTLLKAFGLSEDKSK